MLEIFCCLETTPDALGSIIDHCRRELIGGELIGGAGVMSEAVMAAEAASHFREINLLMYQVLLYLTAAVSSELHEIHGAHSLASPAE